MQVIESINNTYHIPLHNYSNKFCHHIAVIQRLHSSPTLNRELLHVNKKGIENEFVKDILNPIIIYARYEGDVNDNIEIYNKFREYYNYFVDKYVSERGKNGYYSKYDLYYIFMPCIYNVLPDSFERILCELHVDLFNFNEQLSSVHDIITNESESFFKDEYTEELYNLYVKMVNNIPEQIEKHNFVSAVLEIYTSSDCKSGHAITLIKGVNVMEYYIIDDQNTISELSKYYELRKERIYSITIRDIDASTIAEINAILNASCEEFKYNKFSERVSRYELNFSHKFYNINNQRLLRNEYKTDGVTHTSMCNAPRDALCDVLFYLLIGFIIGVVVTVLAQSARRRVLNMNITHVNTS